MRTFLTFESVSLRHLPSSTLVHVCQISSHEAREWLAEEPTLVGTSAIGIHQFRASVQQSLGVKLDALPHVTDVLSAWGSLQADDVIVEAVVYDTDGRFQPSIFCYKLYPGTQFNFLCGDCLVHSREVVPAV